MPQESCGGELVRADQRGKYGQVRQRVGALRQLNKWVCSELIEV